MKATEVVGTLQDIIEVIGNDALICVKEDDSYSRARPIVAVRFERAERDEKIKDVITLVFSNDQDMNDRG
nr:MAG TPA: hypothetical protein [Caudoviricetes sp.]